ncbi:MAG: xanthine dehydrogenase molybdopterin binding subunit [Rhodobacteraceae bacterium]|nr:MAG: xanthine dehydrogenase molybdopterin binding subunit [Paracoccaceae bacterium]
MDGTLEPKAAIDGAAGEARRHDSADRHVAGAALYADDARAPADLLHVAVALSPLAHGRIVSADLSAARAAPGVVAVLDAGAVPGENDTGPVAHDEPMLALGPEGGVACYAGHPLFLVAAETRDAARRAVGLARIEWEKLPAILTVEQAMAAESHVAPPYRMARGDAAAAIAAAPHRVAGSIEIGGQDHFYLEGQIAVATPGEDGEMHVLSSTQHPSETQVIVARVLGLPASAVTVEVRRMGGGFGGKETQGNFCAAAAALVARATGRPAKLRLDRDDDMTMTGKRHAFVIDYEAGVDAEGRILGVRFVQKARCGWSLDLSAAICDRAMFHADNAYFYPAVEIVSYRLRTNTCSDTAFRGFGGPQGMLGAERLMDHIAHALGLDPVEVRRRNFYDRQAGARSVTPYHMRVEDNVIHEIAAEVLASSDYAARRAEIERWNAESPVLKRGLAFCPVKFGISFTTTFLNQAGALVHIYQDGSVLLNHGGTEMGQGLYQKVAQVAASELNIDLGRIRLSSTRTDKVPNTSATAASSGSDMNGMAVRDACRKLKNRLAAFAAERFGVSTDAVRFEPNAVRAGAETIPFEALVKMAYLARTPLSATGFYATPKIWWDRPAAKGRPFYYFAYGAAVCEAVIDTLTGENRILRADLLHDVGRSLNPAIDLGQVEGGFIQGLGWLTTEELWWDDAGRLRTHAPSTYKIPTAGDRPEMRMALWARGENREFTIRRSKAVGEPPLMLANAAFLALSDAARAAGTGGYPALDAPATPERVLAAVARARA